MSVGIYTDVHTAYQIIIGLRLRDVDVITAQEDSADELPDLELLE